MKELKPMLDSFCKYTGVSSAIIDLHGRVIVGANWQRICTDFHRVHTDARQRCIESDTAIVSITVNEVNDPPVAAGQNIEVALDAAGQATITPADVDNGSSDPDGDTLIFSLDKAS